MVGPWSGSKLSSVNRSRRLEDEDEDEDERERICYSFLFFAISFAFSAILIYIATRPPAHPSRISAPGLARSTVTYDKKLEIRRHIITHSFFFFLSSGWCFGWVK